MKNKIRKKQLLLLVIVFSLLIASLASAQVGYLMGWAASDFEKETINFIR